MSVTGRSGPIVEGWPTEKVVTPSILPAQRGRFFSLDTWDGSDFFIPDNSAWLIVIEKVKDIIEQYKLTNISLTKLSEV